MCFSNHVYGQYSYSMRCNCYFFLKTPIIDPCSHHSIPVHMNSDEKGEMLKLQLKCAWHH